MKKITEIITSAAVIGGVLLATVVSGTANAANVVTFEADRSYIRVWTEEGSCYIESGGVCTATFNLYAGAPYNGSAVHRVRYAMYPNNGTNAAQEISHLDAWIQLHWADGPNYTVTVPVSTVHFTGGPGYSTGNGYVVYATSADHVEHFLDATKPTKGYTLDFKVGNTAGGSDANVKLLAGCYTVSFASPWNHTGTGGARPITKFFTLDNPVCVDGVNEQTIDLSGLWTP
jgi:hypothetical protein